MERLITICFVLLGFICLNAATGDEILYQGINCRKYVASLEEFGGVGDGTTSNTAAFRTAIANLSRVAAHGGAMLVVPPGLWLTGSFNLTSHFTLYIHHNATLLGSQEESEYPLIEALPSYGRGRDAPGDRFASLIFGANLTDVAVTGGNGTINGQGEIWWKKFKGKNKLKNTRPYMIEIMSSKQVIISNLTLVNSSSWHVHPVYCTDTIIEGLTIIAPIDSPNTDGINPDSCTNTRIRDAYIISGDDCVAVKSGWDEYGIKYGMPTQHLSIQRLMCISPDSAVIALGSEMSGGITDVRAQDIHALNSQSGVRIKTARGRGGYVKNIYVRDMSLDTMKYVFWASGSYNSHPDGKYDHNALPIVDNINFSNVSADDVSIVGNLTGIEGDTFTNLCFSNVMAVVTKKEKKKKYPPFPPPPVYEDIKKQQKEAWNCGDIQGVSSQVNPPACNLLPVAEKPIECDFPTDTLAIDAVQLKTCSATYSVSE